MSDDINKYWLKENLKEIHNLIKNQISQIEDQNEGEPVTPCMDVYKVHLNFDLQLGKSYCWLYSLSLWDLPLSKVSLCSMIIL